MKRVLLVQTLSANMFSPAVGLTITTGEEVNLNELVGKKFTSYFMTNPALVEILRKRGIDAKLTEFSESDKPKRVYVQDPGDEVYVIRDAEDEYIWQHQLPEDYTICCRKYIVI